jgi:hypothetical protein
MAAICKSRKEALKGIHLANTLTLDFQHLELWESKVLFSSVAHFLIGSLVLVEFSFLTSLYILVISLLSDV